MSKTIVQKEVLKVLRQKFFTVKDGTTIIGSPGKNI